MFEELSDLLKGKVDPAVWAGVSAIATALEKHQATQYKERIQTLRMDANNHDAITLVDEALHIVYDQVRALLQQMQLGLELDTLPMERLGMLLDGLLFVPTDLDQEMLLAIEAGEDSIEAFTDVMAVYLNCAPEELMEFVTDVSADVIAAIGEKLRQNLSYQEQAIDGVQQTVRLINRHQQLVGSTTLGMESFTNGMDVGTSIKTLVEHHKARLAGLPADKLSDELFSLCLLAQVPMEALSDEVMHFIEAILDDPFTVQQAFKRVRIRMINLQELPT